MAKLKYIGKTTIRTTISDGKEINFHPGEVYDDADLTNAYLCGLIAQNFFEVIPDKKDKEKEKDATPKTEK